MVVGYLVPTLSGAISGCVLLAQALPSENIPGVAGWVGTSLLTAVLGWLMGVHLPALAKERKDEQTRQDELKKQEWERHERIQERQRALFAESLKAITDHCEKESSRAASAFEKGIRDIIAELRYRGDDGSKTHRPLET